MVVNYAAVMREPLELDPAAPAPNEECEPIDLTPLKMHNRKPHEMQSPLVTTFPPESPSHQPRQKITKREPRHQGDRDLALTGAPKAPPGGAT